MNTTRYCHNCVLSAAQHLAVIRQSVSSEFVTNQIIQPCRVENKSTAQSPPTAANAWTQIPAAALKPGPVGVLVHVLISQCSGTERGLYSSNAPVAHYTRRTVAHVIHIIDGFNLPNRSETFIECLKQSIVAPNLGQQYIDPGDCFLRAKCLRNYLEPGLPMCAW